MFQLDRLKRSLLYVTAGSIFLAAALGIVLVLRNTWGEWEFRVLLSAIVIALASLCGLACDFSRTPRGWNWIPNAGLALSFAAAIMILVGIWNQIGSRDFGRNYWNTTSALSIFAVATAHFSLLMIIPLARRFQWVLWGAFHIIYLLATLLTAVIISGPRGDNDFRPIAILSILSAAITLLIPILHRIGRTDADVSALDQKNIDSIDAEIDRLKRRLAELEKLREQIGKS